jgi:ribonuclease T2
VKTSLGLILSLALLSSACNSAPTSQPGVNARQDAQPAARNDAPAATASGQPYDFYLLNLSWSPEFCVTHSSNAQCASHPGFVVHGLWPQNKDGSYPQHCASRPGPTSPSVWEGVLPTAELAAHEWEAHGTCTPYDADTYFGLIRRAFQSVKIPADFDNAGSPGMEPPAAIVTDFSKANPGFPSGSIAVSCGNNYLTAIEVCLDKSLNAIACSNVRSCRANNVKIAPR